MVKEKLSEKYQIWQPFLLATMVALGMFVGYKMNDKYDPQLVRSVPFGQDVSIGRVEEIIRFIEARYVDTIPSSKLMDEAINAVLLQLDPHSIYLPPSKIKEVNANMNGSFKGIGIETFYINDTVNILTVVKGSPSDIGGLKQYDQIVAIDDTIVAGRGRDFIEIREMLRKQGRGSVKIEVDRSGQRLIKIINIDDIPIHSADIGIMLNDSIGIIKIEQFSSNSYKEFMESLEHMIEEGHLKHLIIDVRNNPGGYLPEATKILNQLFKEKDQLLVYTIGRDEKQRSEFKTNGKPFFSVDKIAVLVDENSASGSEIIAGALQDLDRATIIGRKTYGKGLVQEQFELSNGGAIRLTTARYYLPSGRSIQKPITSIAEYYDEVDQRYINGQLFHQDTSKLNGEGEYKTLLKHRTVYEKGGIEPDVFIPADSAYYSRNYLRMSSKVTEFVFNQLRKNGTTISSNSTNENWLDELIEQERNKSSKQSLVISESDKRLLLKDLQIAKEYIISNGDRSLQNSLQLKDDRFIKAALALLEAK